MTPNLLRRLFCALLLVLFLSGTEARGQNTYYWDTNGATAGAGSTPTGPWDAGTTAFWTLDPAGTTVTTAITSTLLDTLVFVAGPSPTSGNNPYSVTVSGTQSALGLLLQGSGGNLFFGGTLNLGSGGLTVSEFAFGSTSSNSVQINSALTLNAAQTWTNNSSGGNLVIGGNVTNGIHTITVAGSGATLIQGQIQAGSGGITKNGTGTLTLVNGSNLFLGQTTINAGTLSVGSNGSLGDASAALMLNGGTLRHSSTGNLRAFTLGSNGGTLQFTAATGTNNTGIISGAGSGELKIDVSPGGMYAPNVQSTYTGGTRLLAGITQVATNSSGSPGSITSGPFGTGTLTFAGGQLSTDGDRTIGNAYVLAANVIFPGGFLNLTGSGTISGASRTLDVVSSLLRITGTISDGGNSLGLTKSGHGTLHLSTAHTYTGPTTYNQGFMELDFSLLTSPANIVHSSSHLVLGGSSGSGSASLRIRGKSFTANSQTFNGTTLTGHSALALAPGSSGSLVVNLGTIDRTYGGGLDTSTSSNAQITSTPSLLVNTNGIIAPWVTVGFGNDYATVSGGNIIGLNTASTTPESGWIDPTANYRFTTSQTLTGNRTANTLRFNGGSGSFTLNLDANNLTLNGLLASGGGGVPSFALTVFTSGGSVVIGSTGELVLAGPRYLNINAPISGVNGRLVKIGTNTVTLDAGSNPTFNGGITVNAGSLNLSGGGSYGNNPIFVGFDASLSNVQFSNTAYTREVFGDGGIGATFFFSFFNMTVLKDTVSNIAANSTEFQLNTFGPGKYTLTGALASTGGSSNASVSGGELIIATGDTTAAFGQDSSANAGGIYTLDNTAGNSSKYGDSQTFTLTGGTFRLIGNASAATTETLGQFFYTDGLASVIDIQRAGGQSATLSAGNLTRGVIGSALNIKTNNAAAATINFLGAPTLVNGIVNGVFFNGADFATHSGDSTPIIATSYTNPTDINTATSTQNILVNSSTTTTTLTGTVAMNALKIDGAQTIDLNNNQLHLGSSTLAAMILKTGSGDATIVDIFGGGTGQIRNQGATDMDFLVRVDAGSLTIRSAVNLVGTASFAKSGSGLLILTPTEGWSFGGSASSADVLRVQEGAIRMDPLDGFIPNFTRQLAGGVFELLADWNTSFVAVGTTSNGLAIAANADGGFAAFGAPRTVTVPVAWGQPNNIGNGRALLLNSSTADWKIEMAGSVNLGTNNFEMWFREIRVASGSTANAFAEISGAITGDNQHHLLKTGPGRLDITGTSNTYAGETMIHGGRLNVNGSLSSLSEPNHGTVTAMSGGTLGGTGAINRPVVIESGGTLAPGNNFGTLTVLSATLEAGSKFAFYQNTSVIPFSAAPGTGASGTAGSINNLLSVNSNLTVDDPTTLTILINGDMNFFSPNSSYSFLVATATNAIAAFNIANQSQFDTTGFTNYSGEFNFALQSLGTNVYLDLTPVPEPTSILALAAGVLGVGGYVRRRR